MASPEHDFAAFRARGDMAALARVFDALAAELLLVAAHVAPRGACAEDLVQLAAAQTHDLDTIRLPASPPANGTLTVRVQPEGGVAVTVDDLMLELRSPSGNGTSRFTREGDGRWRSAPVPAGSYELWAWGRDFAPTRRAIDVPPAADAAVELAVAKAVPVRFTFVQPEPRRERWVAALLLRIHDARGRAVFDSLVGIDGGDTFAWTRGFPPGDYSYTALVHEDGPGPAADGRFTVPGREHQPVDVRVDLEVPQARGR